MCNELESSPTILPPNLRPVEKLSPMKLIPGAQEAGQYPFFFLINKTSNFFGRTTCSAKNLHFPGCHTWGCTTQIPLFPERICYPCQSCELPPDNIQAEILLSPCSPQPPANVYTMRIQSLAISTQHRIPLVGNSCCPWAGRHCQICIRACRLPLPNWASCFFHRCYSPLNHSHSSLSQHLSLKNKTGHTQLPLWFWAATWHSSDQWDLSGSW